GGGSARDVLSVRDHLFAGAGDEGVTYAHAVGLLGMTDVALIDDLIDALGAGDGATVFETVDRVVEAGHDPRRFAGDLLDRLRDLVLLDAVPDATDKGLVDVPGEQLERMSAQAAQLGTASLSRLADVVHEGLADMRGTTSPRLVLELLCARMLLPAASSDAAAVLQRVERLERRQSIATPSRPEAAGAAASPESTVPRPPRRTPEAAPDPAASRVPVEPSASEAAAPAELGPSTERPAPTAASAGPPTSVASAEGGDIDAAAVRRVWPEVMQRVKVSSRRTHALMHNAAVSTVDGQELILVAESVPLTRMLGEESNVEMIAAALREILGVAWRVRVVPQGAEPAARAAAAAPSEPVATTTPDEPAPDATPSASTGEPDPRDDTPDDREDAAPAARADPDEAALSLLKDSLGAETVE
ncbi:MAG: DNA polymerase III subunit gamma/tau, partial [Mycobacteriales bacterium]